jgi:N-acetylmuramoyl-L-alanine amidase
LIGNAGIHFTAEVVSPNPPRLVMNFSSSVNPSIHQDSGQLRLVFEHDPIVAPGSPLLTFGNATIPSARYQAENGTAEISIAGTVPLFASLSNEGRTITVTTTPSAQTAQAQQAAANSTTPAVPMRRYFAVVDASHGGSERGAALNDQIAEKDVTLAFARLLRQELEARGINTLLIRDGDMNMSQDQRASIVNAVHPAIYICLHAASQGNGVRLYTALLPPAEENRGPFVNWNTAQSAFRGVSQTAETSVSAQLQKSQIPVRRLQAALRPLNNIMAAAIAVEVAPQQNDVRDLVSPLYQQAVTSSLATAVIALRANLEAGR